jgi:hypothetical protein
MTNLVDQLTAISRALASTLNDNLMLLRVSRNIILSLLEYNAPALEPGRQTRTKLTYTGYWGVFTRKCPAL